MIPMQTCVSVAPSATSASRAAEIKVVSILDDFSVNSLVNQHPRPGVWNEASNLRQAYVGFLSNTFMQLLPCKSDYWKRRLVDL